MSKLNLGENVTAIDYLVRVRADELGALDIAKHWAALPTRIQDEAQRRVDRYEEHREREQGFSYDSQYLLYGNADMKLWIPASVYREISKWHPERRGVVYLDNRNNPVAVDVALPLTGIVTQKTQLMDGFASDSAFSVVASRTAYRVAYDLHRCAVAVYPEMLASES